MKLHVVGTGSSGNCYLLEGERQTLLLDCGVRFEAIKKSLNFELLKVAGCLITHEHMDHAKAAEDVAKAGIKIYTSKGTASKLGFEHHRINCMSAKTNWQIGEFTVMAFDVQHDAAEPFGFLIKHPECGTALFITDTCYVKYKFAGINNFIVEANYDINIVNQRLESGSSVKVVRDRVIESHMSIDTCCDLLLANDLRKANNIVLIHLSDANSNAKEFAFRVATLTGKAVYVATNGMIIPFDKTPF